MVTVAVMFVKGYFAIVNCMHKKILWNCANKIFNCRLTLLNDPFHTLIIVFLIILVIIQQCELLKALMERV